MKECSCSPAIVTRYQKRVSGPLLDRIDIHVEVPRVEYEKLASETALERSGSIRARMEEARERQRQRFEGTSLSCNAEMGPGEVREYCGLDDGGRSLLRSAMQQLQMNARAFHRILKLARTIGDLANGGEITTALGMLNQDHQAQCQGAVSPRSLLSLEITLRRPTNPLPP